MNSINIIFDQELADFFGISSRIDYPLIRKASIKDIIEAQGVPHTEVGEILAGCRPAGFDLIPRAGQQITVLGVQAPLDIHRPSLLRPRPFSDKRFVVDVNAGKLAPLLRLLGYDARFSHQFDDDRIAEIAYNQQRVVLSRDRGLLKRSRIEYGRLVRAQSPVEQLKEIAVLFNLNSEKMFTRCLKCNFSLEDIDKQQIIHRLQPKTIKYFNRFAICTGCGQIFWPGSHWEKMNELVKNAGIC